MPPERAQPWGNSSHEAVLALIVLGEVVVFSLLGTNFLSLGNAAEVLRAATPVGLLALALTPVIVSGGIDLSVGSLLGFSAVVLGELWRDGGVPLGTAVPLTLALGAAAGALNALLVARLRMPALIVTLGTFSLFRGLAEGLTAGVENYTGFPAGFLRLGQGYLLGAIPTQALVLVAAAALYGVLLHASVAGRALYAIGFSPEGARHAGLPVGRRLALVYVLSGVMAALAGLVYVAYLGQAKADAGTGYELTAITAVVLGGTSIFGGRGTIHGTLLGVAALAVLHNGLRLADLPTEMAGVLTGLLLVAAILARRWLAGERTTT
ncbi:MAG TPA: ABC transporter permease [Vicinamibacteria bacterium]|nr:ABC transporter permease [Vicinamibacteria bacterium]